MTDEDEVWFDRIVRMQEAGLVLDPEPCASRSARAWLARRGRYCIAVTVEDSPKDYTVGQADMPLPWAIDVAPKWLEEVQS